MKLLLLSLLLVSGIAQAIPSVEPIEKVGYDESPEYIVVLCYRGNCFNDATGEHMDSLVGAPDDGYYRVPASNIQYIDPPRKVKN